MRRRERRPVELDDVRVTHRVHSLGLSPKLLERLAARRAACNNNSRRLLEMFEQMNKEDYGQSLREYYLIGTPEYDEYLKKLTPGETVKEKLNQWDELDEDAEYQGKKVKLNNPVRGGNKKFYVYVKNDKGNIIKVSFGDSTGLSIKRDDPERRKAFRARHNCDQKKDKTTAGYWSCKFWEKGKSVTDLMKG